MSACLILLFWSVVGYQPLFNHAHRTFWGWRAHWGSKLSPSKLKLGSFNQIFSASFLTLLSWLVSWVSKLSWKQLKLSENVQHCGFQGEANAALWLATSISQPPNICPPSKSLPFSTLKLATCYIVKGLVVAAFFEQKLRFAKAKGSFALFQEVWRKGRRRQP